MEELCSVISQLKTGIAENIDLSRKLNDEEVMDYITESVFEFSKNNFLSASEKIEVITSIFNSMRRLDILQPIIEDPFVTEIMVNGPEHIFIEKNGQISELDIKFESREKLEDLIQAIVYKVNRSVNEANPVVDARLPDGSRVNAVLNPIALDGPILTIRKFPEKRLIMSQLTSIGSISPEAEGFLEKAVKARYNIFVCGGTGSGKTTFLNALSGCIPKGERIITIEDSAELQLDVRNLVRLETRNPNTENKGEISIRQLIKTSLRMRPDRIIVGEVRGEEALDMLQAMNTGHDGSLSTGHANSCRDMLGRLETMVLCGAQLPLEAIRQQIASAIEIIIFVSRLRDGSRKVLEITEIDSFIKEEGQIRLNPLFMFNEEKDFNEPIGTPTRIKGSLKRTENKMQRIQKFRMAGIENFL